MTGLPLATDRPAERARIGVAALGFTVVGLSTALVLVGLAGLVVASPPYLDGALDRAGSPAILGLSAQETHALSESVVAELLVGPGTFAQTVTDPNGEAIAFFGPAEGSHLRDFQLLVRLLALASVGAFLVLFVGLIRARGPWVWRAMSRGAGALTIGMLVVAAAFVFAFEPAFTILHLVFFPEGNWSFDPRVARMVQLYNPGFWEEVTVVYAVLTLALSGATWFLARERAAQLADGS